jgi:hypothetical protein
MRRLIAIVLLLLLPVQFAFAAAAPYCALEKSEAPVHFGHHEHPDDVPPATSDDKDEGGNSDDCSICHFASAQPPASIAATAFSQPPSLESLPNDRQPQHLQEPSERPPRTSLA